MNKFILLLFSLFIFSCNNQQTQNNSKTSPVADSAKSPIAIQKGVNTSSLNLIKDWKGKLAREAGMFDNSTLDNRFTKILGEKEFTELKNNWNVETPFEEENGIYSASGCKVHDCAANHYIVYFDVDNNNINIEISKDKASKLFTEKGIITLPPKMQKDLDATKSNL